MEKKDLIIGAFNNFSYEVLKPWIASIQQSGFKGDVVLVAVDAPEEVVNEITNTGVAVISVKNDVNLRIHMLRFLHIFNFLRTNHKNYRYVVTTDVRDVIFQKNPSDYLEQNLGDKKLIAQSEAIKIKDESWNRDNIQKNFGQFFYDDIKDNHVFNVGLLAGEAEYVKDLCFSLFQMSLNRPDWVADQAAFNVLMSYHPWTDVTKKCNLSDAWAINAHVTNKPDQLQEFGPYLLEPRPSMIDGKIVNHEGKEFVIVHQYDRVPEWMEYFMEKFQFSITKDSNTGTAPKYFTYKTN